MILFMLLNATWILQRYLQKALKFRSGDSDLGIIQRAATDQSPLIYPLIYPKTITTTYEASTQHPRIGGTVLLIHLDWRDGSADPCLIGDDLVGTWQQSPGVTHCSTDGSLKNGQNAQNRARHLKICETGNRYLFHQTTLKKDSSEINLLSFSDPLILNNLLT